MSNNTGTNKPYKNVYVESRGVTGTQSKRMGHTKKEREFNKKVSYPYNFAPPKWVIKYFTNQRKGKAK